MGGRGAGFLVALAAASGAGCGELYDKNWNALGHVKIEEPPRSPESRRVEQPADPGVRIVWLNAGILAGVGAKLSSPSRAAYGVGGEVSLHVGASDHSTDTLFPRRSLGLNVGTNVVDSSVRGGGPSYAEAQLMLDGFWTAGGWAYDFVGQAQGPQATIGFGPLYLRYRQLFDRDGSILMGLAIKGGVTWVTSR